MRTRSVLLRSGKVEVTNCFPVPHTEKEDEVAVGKDFFAQMYDLHRKACPKEEIVGWYATTAGDKQVDYVSNLVDEFFGNECEDTPVHIVVDTSLAGSELGIKAYSSRRVILAGENRATEYQELPLSTDFDGKERQCIQQMVSAPSGDDQEESKKPAAAEVEVEEKGPLAEVDVLQATMARLLEMLDTVTKYVDDVVAGQAEPNVEWGRLIASTVAAVPRVKVDEFSKAFNGNLEDVLMVAYLSNLTRAQIAISGQLQKRMEA
eukprot:g4621.t1